MRYASVYTYKVVRLMIYSDAVCLFSSSLEMLALQDRFGLLLRRLHASTSKSEPSASLLISLLVRKFNVQHVI
jgi:hypothetical protein